MGGLLKWEMKQTFASKYFWVIGAALVIFPALLLIMTLRGSDVTGYEAFLEGVSNYGGVAMFLAAVFAGIHVTGAFEGRKIQAAVMAGNSRAKILLSKFFSYAFAITLINVVSIAVSTGIAFYMKGMGGIDGTFVRMIIGRALIYALIQTAFVSVCFLADMFIRHLGAAIGFNLVMMMILNIGSQAILGYDWAEKFLRFIPAGQTFMIIGDMGNKNILMAIASVAISFVAIPVLSYVRFGKEELK